MFYRNIAKNTFNPALNWNNYVPPEISGLQLWLDASQLNLANNNAVASWTDLSGNGNHATQGTDDYKPLFKTSVQNGLPGILFDGSNDYLSVAHNANLNCYPITIFLVAKTNSNTQYSSLFSKFVNKSVSDIQGYSLENNSGKYNSIYYKNKDNRSAVLTVNTINDNTAKLIKIVVNSSGNNISINNGTLQTTAWTGSPSATTNTYNLLLAASRNASVVPALFNSCTFFEFGIWNKELSAGENTAMNSYLSQKWGIAIA